MYKSEDQQHEAVNALIDSALSQVNTSIPGVIQSFNPATQTGTVQCAINRTDSETGDDVKYPLLVDVPIVCPSGGGYSLTFPIESGDDCLVCFSQKNIDGWFESGEIKAEAENRRHDLSDGVAIIGLKNQGAAVQNWDMQGVEIRDKAGTTAIHIEENKISLMIGATGIEITPAGISLVVGGTSFNIGAAGTTSNMNISTTGDVHAGAISLTNHVHSGVQAGASNTGAPQ